MSEHPKYPGAIPADRLALCDLMRIDGVSRALIFNGDVDHLGAVKEGLSVLVPYRQAAQRELLGALEIADSFMSGFEGDEAQDGIDAKIITIRAAIAMAKGGKP